VLSNTSTLVVSARSPAPASREKMGCGVETGRVPWCRATCNILGRIRLSDPDPDSQSV